MHLIYIKSGKDYIYSLSYTHSTVKTTLTLWRESKRSGQNLLLPVLACKRKQQRHYLFIFLLIFAVENCRYTVTARNILFVITLAKRGSTQASIPSHARTHARTRSEAASFHCRMSKAPVGRRFGVLWPVCVPWTGGAFPRRGEIKSAKTNEGKKALESLLIGINCQWRHGQK